MKFRTGYLALAASVLLISSISAIAVEIDATEHLDPERGDQGIQAAIDAAAEAGGGTIIIPEGEYIINRYLYLRSNVTLQGQGEKTVLTLGEPSRTNVLSQDAPQGATELTVDGDLTGLEPGMIIQVWRSGMNTHGIHIRSYRVVEVRGQTVVIDKPNPFHLRLQFGPPHICWGMTTALAAPAVKGEQTIRVEHPHLFRAQQGFFFKGKGDQWDHHFNAAVEIEGDVITLDRALTVDAPTGTQVNLQHSAITADGEKNIGVEDLVVRGWKDKLKPVSGGFPLSGVHFVRVEDVTIRNVEVHHWNADGFSIQAGENLTVEDCVATNNRGHGYHPGTSWRNAEFVNIRGENNGNDGLYYCWHNRNVNVRDSVFIGNGKHGIGGLGVPGDHNNTIEGNTIERNGQAGIEMPGGNDTNNMISNNIIRDNSQAKPGEWPGILITAIGSANHSHARKITVEGNTIESTLEEATQWVGIEERHVEVNPELASSINGYHIADQNRIIGNKLSGHRTADIIVRGPNTIVEDNKGAIVEERLELPKNE